MVITASIVLLIIFIIFVVEAYQACIRIHKVNSKYSGNKISFTTTYYFAYPLVLYIFYLVHISLIILDMFSTKDNCSITKPISVISYVLAKGSLYGFFILRLYVIYKKSVFAYSPKILLFLTVLLIIYATVSIILIILTFKTELIHQEIINYCTATFAIWINIYAIVNDQLITFYAVYLFTKPIVHLIKTQRRIEIDSDSPSTTRSRTRSRSQSAANNGQDEREIVVIVKVAALSFISSITSFMAIVGVGTIL